MTLVTGRTGIPAASASAAATAAAATAAATTTFALAQGIKVFIADITEVHRLRCSCSSHLGVPDSDHLISQLVISVKLLEGHKQVLLQWPIHKIPKTVPILTSS